MAYHVKGLQGGCLANFKDFAKAYDYAIKYADENAEQVIVYERPFTFNKFMRKAIEMHPERLVFVYVG